MRPSRKCKLWIMLLLGLSKYLLNIICRKVGHGGKTSTKGTTQPSMSWKLGFFPPFISARKKGILIARGWIFLPLNKNLWTLGFHFLSLDVIGSTEYCNLSMGLLRGCCFRPLALRRLLSALRKFEAPFAVFWRYAPLGKSCEREGILVNLTNSKISTQSARWNAGSECF